MRSPRGPLSPSPITLALVAIVAIPEILKRCKPLAKTLGDFLVRAGTEVNRIAEADAQTTESKPKAADVPTAQAAESIPESEPRPATDAPNPTDDPNTTDAPHPGNLVAEPPVTPDLPAETPVTEDSPPAAREPRKRAGKKKPEK